MLAGLSSQSLAVLHMCSQDSHAPSSDLQHRHNEAVFIRIIMEAAIVSARLTFLGFHDEPDFSERFSSFFKRSASIPHEHV